MKVLIVKLGSIGDIVHTLPVLAAIRSDFPEAEIGWVVERHSAAILKDNPLIDHLIEVDTRSLRRVRPAERFLGEVKKQVVGLREYRFDMALDLQGLLKSAMIAKLSGAKRRVGFAGRAMREPAGRVFLTNTVRVPREIHVIRKNLALARGALGMSADIDEKRFPIFTNEEDRKEAEALVDAAGRKFAILNPAGGWVTKLWPAERFGLLADRIADELDLTPVVVSGPNEGELVDRVRNSSRSGRTIYAIPGLKPFFEFARSASIYVGGDTGPTHIAIAAGTPVVGLFGPTEWWRNGSIDPRDICVERTDITCRENCHRRTCSKWICMDIDVDRVFNAVRDRLRRS